METVRVTIFNQSYTLAATATPGEIEQIAASVDELMTQVAAAQRSAHVDATRVAVLACLHLSDRLRSLEKGMGEMHTRVDRCIEMLDEGMAARK